jgi:hypothetical protein
MDDAAWIATAGLGGPGDGSADCERPLLEQAQQGLRRLVRQRQGLRAKLLADLQGCQLSRFLGQVRVNQRAQAAVQRIDLVIVVGYLIVDIVDRGANLVQLFRQIVLLVEKLAARLDEPGNSGIATKLGCGEVDRRIKPAAAVGRDRIGRAEFVSRYLQVGYGGTADAARDVADQRFSIVAGILDSGFDAQRQLLILCYVVTSLTSCNRTVRQLHQHIAHAAHGGGDVLECGVGRGKQTLHGAELLVRAGQRADR